MKIDVNSLTDDPEQLKQMLLDLQAKTSQALAPKDKIITEQAIQINQFIERYEIAKRKQFGKSSEQLLGAGETFNEAEEIVDEGDKALLAETGYNKNVSVKRIPKSKPLPKVLLRKIVTIDLAIAEQVCGCCQGHLHKMGEARSEKLEFVHAHIKVIETVRLKYTCKQFGQTGTGHQVKIAPMPAAPIPKLSRRRAC